MASCTSVFPPRSRPTASRRPASHSSSFSLAAMLSATWVAPNLDNAHWRRRRTFFFFSALLSPSATLSSIASSTRIPDTECFRRIGSSSSSSVTRDISRC
eukprot:5486262-Prymnesium_polylepis.3